MKNVGGFLYESQAAAENAAAQRRSKLIGLVEQLEELNESIDSEKLSKLIRQQKFELGL